MTADDSEFEDIEHRFDPVFYFRNAKRFAEQYIKGAFEQHPATFGIENLASVDAGTSRVYVLPHKSHLDYILFPYITAVQFGHKPPAIAAGDNLFKKIGPLDFDKWIRKSRGYKIIRHPPENGHRRTFRKLLDYVTKLIGDNEDILVFPEAGRSYTGEIKPFRDASLGIFATAAQHTKKKIAYVPAAISYERVPEDRFMDVFGRHKKNPTLLSKLKYYLLDWPVIFTQQYFHKPLGTAVLRFGKPYVYEPADTNNYRETNTMITGLMEERCKKLVELTPAALLARACTRTEISIYEAAASVRLDVAEAEMEQLPATLLQGRNIEEIIGRGLTFLDTTFRRFVAFDGNKLRVRNPEVVSYYARTVEHHFARQPQTAKSFLTAQ